LPPLYYSKKLKAKSLELCFLKVANLFPISSFEYNKIGLFSSVDPNFPTGTLGTSEGEVD